jgi:phospholipid/cholesterol/gamma-HCH transport system permease protein
VGSGAPVLRLDGRWILADLGGIRSDLTRALALLKRPVAAGKALLVDGAGLEVLDTAAANLLLREISGREAQLTGFGARHRRVLEMVASHQSTLVDEPAADVPPGLLWRLGKAGYAIELKALGLLGFLGLLTVALSSLVAHPRRLRWRETLIQCRHCGLEAIPVIILITFLIGVVVAYLLGLQASKYGASVFVIDGVALGMVREFSPLLVATIIAGRSGAAFTAQLGTMKLAEEIDAVRMTGLSPEQVLVVPRVLGLVITLPLLVFIGDVAGLAGAASVCHLMLDLTPATFIDRVRANLGVVNFAIGLSKAPVFALAIAVIGCHMGTSVKRDTRAIGDATTATVVQSIVAVIVLDAVFAIALQGVGL